MSKQAIWSPGIFEYIEQQLNIPKDLKPQDPHFMQISPSEAIFLQFLIRSIQAKRILEIGCLNGYSAACMAKALPADGRVISCDHDKRVLANASAYWAAEGVADKIELHISPASAFLHQLIEKNARFDFIFIDADKRHVIDYYEAAKQLIQKQGIIAIDNTLYHAEVISKQPSKAAQYIIDFNEYVKQDPDVNAFILAIGDGLSIVQRKT